MDVIFDPLIPLNILYGLAACAVAFLSLAFLRRLPGWWLRTVAVSLLLVALANPALQDKESDPLSDIVVVVSDESASQKLSDRAGQSALAVERLTRDIAAQGMEMRLVTVPDGAGDAGTELMRALDDVLADLPKARIAGMILVTDGQLHDLERAPVLDAPLHTLLSGHSTDWDRRLVVKNAPAFAILNEEVKLTLMIEDQGAVPGDVPARAELSIAVDGQPPNVYQVPVGEELELPLKLSHGGMNILQFELEAMDGELTDRNNSAVIQINGVRDRLRVLLVSGEPHAGERTWRNLLKSDSAVDLVHFTILRPPEKQDGVPVSELSLIAFPTRELFLDKIGEFDLIIFDRYKRRGILPPGYFESIRQYVEKGGAVLVAAGPDFASADSLQRSSLGQIFPVRPTARVLEEGFRPMISDMGHRHPVTQGLEGGPESVAVGDGEKTDDATGHDTPAWGRWIRQIEVEALGGQTVMTGLQERPLLTLDRVGEGRVAILASDHAWLWHRGFEGGGPQLELLRRLAHWLMKEPELEEEALIATAEGRSLTVTRRTLSETVGAVEITFPDGETRMVELEQTAPGRFSTTLETAQTGLYRFREGDLETVMALGPAAPREFVETIASGDKLAGLVRASRGGMFRLEDAIPRLRLVGRERNAAGRNWIGLTPRDASVTTSIVVTPLVSAWLFLILAVVFCVGAWLREGRR